MNYLLAASLPLLIFAFGTATSIATTKALRGWAVATVDVRTARATCSPSRRGRRRTSVVDGLLEIGRQNAARASTPTVE
jgi:hypothetical protein